MEIPPKEAFLKIPGFKLYFGIFNCKIDELLSVYKIKLIQDNDGNIRKIETEDSSSKR